MRIHFLKAVLVFICAFTTSVTYAQVIDKDMPINDRLKAANDWAEKAAALQPTEGLVVTLEFIKEKLGFTSDPSRPKGVVRFSDKALLSAARLNEAAMAVANRFPAETDSDEFIKTWDNAKPGFKIAIKSESDEAQEAWMQFLTEWENQVLKTDKSQFREALLQMPLIVTGLLLGFEKAHIEAVMAGGGPRASTTQTSSSSGAYSYSGASHVLIHHTRTMNRITERHVRRMRAIGY